MGGRGAVWIAVALVCGLAAGTRWPGVATAMLVAATACVALAVGPSRARPAVPLLAALALSGAARGAAHAERLERLQAGLRPEGAPARFAGTVVEPPSDAAAEPVVVVRVSGGDPDLPAGSRVRLRLPGGTRVEWSDSLAGLAEVEPPAAPRNPGGFDGRRFAAASDLVAGGRAVWCARAPAPGLAAWPRVTFGRWRSAIERRLLRRLTPEARELVVPLVLGDRSEMPVPLGAELRVAGLVHLIALSGLHVTWLAALARTLAGAAGCGAPARSAAGAVCALFYLGIAGPIPSLARAAVSEVLASLAGVTSRRVDPLQALAVSVVALLAAHPEWILDLGFALSCTATLGLVTVGAALPRARGRTAGLAQAVAASLGAQLMSLPLLLSSFHLLPWIGPAANLAAVPVAGLLLSAAWLALLIDLAVPGLGSPWFGSAEALAAALRGLTHLASRVPGAARAVGDDPGLVVVAALGAGLLAVACARRDPPAAERGGATGASEAAAVIGAALSLAALLRAAGAPELRPPPGTWWVVGLDVGQGDATAVGTAGGWWLVDAGPRGMHSDAGVAVVLPFLRWAGVRRLEAVFITHDDSDHWGGAPAVLDGVTVRRVIAPPPRPGAPGPAARFAADTASAGTVLGASPPIVVRWPDREAQARPLPAGITADNANALVLEVGEGRGRALLLADVDSTTEQRLVVRPGPGLLKVGHHGAGASSGGAFLERLRPRLALVSCGRRNRYGHPDAGALARLAAAGARIVRTDRDGAVWCALGAEGQSLVDWRSGQPESRAAPRVARRGTPLPSP